MWPFSKKKKEEKQVEEKTIYIPCDCDQGRGNIYYDVDSKIFFDFICCPIVYDLWHTLWNRKTDWYSYPFYCVIGTRFDYKYLSDYSYLMRDDIRYMKVLDENYVKTEVLKYLMDSTNCLLLKNGFVKLKSVLMKRAELPENYKDKCFVWDVNDGTSLAYLMNNFQDEQKEKFMKLFRDIEYEQFTIKNY